MKKHSQKRKHERATVFIPIYLHIEGKEPLKGEIEDISQGGAYVRVAHSFKVGDQFLVEVFFSITKSQTGVVVEIDEIEADAPLRTSLLAQVRWVRDGSGIGIQFASVSKPMARFLDRLVKYFNRMKHEFDDIRTASTG